MFLAVFAVARLLGAAMQLATIHSPKNVSLYIGSATLNNIGLSPLMLATLGLISRVRYSVQKSRQTILPPTIVRLDEILTIVALILSIVGATSLPLSDFTGGKMVAIPTTMTVSVILFIAAYCGLVLFTALLWLYFGDIELGEKRLLVVITLSLPFLLVRIIYTALATLRQLPNFSWINGSTTIFLCMALIMEAAIVAIYEGTGLTLQQLSPDDMAQIHAERQRRGYQGSDVGSETSQDGIGYKLVGLGKKTAIGRVVTKVTGD